MITSAILVNLIECVHFLFQGLSAGLRSRIEESICSRDGVVAPTCFDPAMVLVARVLQQRYLAKFLNSNLYRKYLSELFSQIQTGPYKSGGGGGSGRKVSRRGFGLRRSGSNTSLSTCSSSEVSRSFGRVWKLFTCGEGDRQV